MNELDQSTVAARRGRPAQPELARARREQILAKATQHFAAHGYHATDMQRLADELQLGKGTVYRYFASKEALFLAAVDRVMMLLLDHTEAARTSSNDTLAAIERVISAYLAFFDARPEFVELLIQERAVFRDRKTPTYFEHRARNVGRWQALFAQLMDDGRLRRKPPDAITDVLSSALYGTMFTNFFAGRRKSLETQAAQIVDILLRGILSDAEREKRADSAETREMESAS